MPLGFHIIPRRNLVLVDCIGHIHPEESREAFGRYMAHPDFTDGQMHLIDASRATGYGTDPTDYMELQARLAAAMPKGPGDLVLAYYAPNREGQRMAEIAKRAWSDVAFARIVVADTERAVLELLGLPERSLEDLRKVASDAHLIDMTGGGS